MKFSDLKFAQKLGLGFGLLIVIAATLGIIAVVNMQSISTKSEHLAHEYVPELELANNIERTALNTMYAMRGYGFTEEERFLNEGTAHLKDLEKLMNDAEKLAQTATQLDALQGAIDETQSAVTTYQGLVQQTVETNKKLTQLRANMDVAASNFMTNCMDYLDNQNRQLDNEIRQGSNKSALEERHDKITWINDIIDKGNGIRVANFKAQATRDPIAYEAAMNNFNIGEEVRNLRSVTRLSADIQALDQLDQSANNYLGSMQEFLNSWEERERLNVQRNEAGNIVLTESQEVATASVGNTKRIADESVAMLGVSSAVMIFGLIIAMIIGILLAVAITRSITAGLRRGVSFATQVSKGDLTVNLEDKFTNRKDEIGMLSQALTGMVSRLRDIVENILNGSEGIAGASGEMASTSQQMSQGASEQAASVEEVSSSMEEMVSNIQQNTDNAQQTEK